MNEIYSVKRVTESLCLGILACLMIASACTKYENGANVSLRSAADREALLVGLADGSVDAIATDHAPHFDAPVAR